MSVLNKTWFDEYLEEDPSREVRFIGRDGYSEHAQYISKRKSFTGELRYTVKAMSTGEILEITSEQITDILRPKNWLEYWNNN